MNSNPETDKVTETDNGTDAVESNDFINEIFDEPVKVKKVNERFTKSPYAKVKKERRCKNKAARKSRKVNRKK